MDVGSSWEMTWCDGCTLRASLALFREGAGIKGVVGITLHVLVTLQEQITVQCDIWHHKHTPISEE